MTRRLTMLGLLLAVALTGCAATSGGLEGSWILVRVGDCDLDVGEHPDQDDSVKILSRDRFAFASQDAGGELFAGGGTWRRDGDTYVEIIRYHSRPALVGAVAEFDCRLDGDLWYHIGEIETDQGTFHVDEVWRRLEAEGDH